MPGTGFDVFSVAMNTSTGTQALVGTCEGNTPKAAIVLVTRATVVGTITDVGTLSMGITDGMTTRSVSHMSEDGQAVASYNTGRRSESALGTILTATSQALDGSFDFSSFSADTLTINITDAPTSAVQLVVILFYGDDLQVKLDTVAASGTANGTTVYSGLSFRPRAIFALNSIAGITTSGLHARASCGVCTFDDDTDTTRRQLSWGVCDRDTPTTLTRIRQNVRNNAIIQRILNLDNGNLSENAWYEITAQSSTGFTLTTRNENLASNLWFLAFRFGSSRTWCGFPAFSTASTATQAITEPGFRPQFVMAWGTGHQEANVNVIQDGVGELVGSLTLGACVEVGTDKQAAFQHEQGTGTGDTRCLVSSKLVELVDDAGLVTWDATLASYDATGLSIDVGTASGNDKLMGIWVVEANRQDTGWLAEAKSGSRWRRRLARM